MNAKMWLHAFALGSFLLTQVAAAPAGKRYCEKHPKDPRCSPTVTPEIRKTEFPPIESTPTDIRKTLVPSETPETPAPTEWPSATPTASATPGQGLATPTTSSTPTSTETATETPTQIASPSPTQTGTNVVPTPTDEVIPKDCFSGRRTSGEGTKIGFCAGEEVFGYEIGLDDGRVCTGGNCWLPIAPEDGWVLSGVVNPWVGEVPFGTDPWIEPSCSGRRTTGDGGTARFCQGEEVFGVDITLDDGSSCSGGACWLPSAPIGGWVVTGVINPWEGEVPPGTEFWYPYGAPPPTDTPAPSLIPEQEPAPEEETQNSSLEPSLSQNLGTKSPDGWYEGVIRDGEFWVIYGNGQEFNSGMDAKDCQWLADWSVLCTREDNSLVLTDRLATFTRELGVSGELLTVSVDGEWVKLSNDGHPTVVSVHGARYGLGSADAQAFAHIVFPDHASGP